MIYHCPLDGTELDSEGYCEVCGEIIPDAELASYQRMWG